MQGDVSVNPAPGIRNSDPEPKTANPKLWTVNHGTRTLIPQPFSKAFYHFITQLCAIVGGVFTVAGIVASIMDKVSSLAVAF